LSVTTVSASSDAPALNGDGDDDQRRPAVLRPHRQPSVSTLWITTAFVLLGPRSRSGAAVKS
jgi:hypothetical protein